MEEVEVESYTMGSHREFFLMPTSFGASERSGWLVTAWHQPILMPQESHVGPMSSSDGWMRLNHWPCSPCLFLFGVSPLVDCWMANRVNEGMGSLVIPFLGSYLVGYLLCCTIVIEGISRTRPIMPTSSLIPGFVNPSRWQYFLCEEGTWHRSAAIVTNGKHSTLHIAFNFFVLW